MLQMKKSIRANESLAQKHVSKIQTQEEQLRKKSLEITNLKNKLKEEKTKDNKKSSIEKAFAGNLRPKDRMGPSGDSNSQS